MKILLIDDDINLSKVLKYQLEKAGNQVEVANRGESGINLFKKQDFDVVITDIQMPEISGMEILQTIRRKDSEVIVIIITAYGTIDNAVEACRLGADDYLLKPFGQEQLLFAVEKAVKIRRLQKENIELRSELLSRNKFENIIFRSSQMEEVMKMAVRVAQSDATVLVQGESGTGKELIARTVHYNSPKKDKPLITVNCPSIPDSLLESELFGHVKGSFTGAIKDRIGKFEQASNGTIFLDEIGELKEELQAKLLRVLQEQEIERVGAEKTIKINTRIIAATNKDLIFLVKEGKFREDLYYRLNVVPITIPPLRDRKEDIPVLVNYFLEKFGKNKKYGISSKALEILENYNWPGNVRELENTIERILALATNLNISPQDIPDSIKTNKQVIDSSGFIIPEEGIALDDIERKVISEVLNRTNRNQTKSAKLLKIPRHVLIYRMKKLGIR